MAHPRMHNAQTARAAHGAVFDRLAEALHRRDPPADAVAAHPASLRLLDRALRHGLMVDDPAPLRALIQAVEATPAWVDPARVAAGGRLARRAGQLTATLLALRSLVGGYYTPEGNKPLVLTGRLTATDAAPRRLGETARFVNHVVDHGGLARHAPGFISAVKVRVMHAAVRRLVDRSGKWDAASWAQPINQHDMLATVLLFSSILIDGYRTVGLRVTRAEAEDYMHLWRYVGWLMGVEAELLPATEAEAQRYQACIRDTLGPPDADSRALVDALFQVGERQARTPGEARRARRLRPVVQKLCRAFIGDPAADALGLPKGRWPLHALRVAVAAGELTRRALPFGDLAFDRLGMWQLKRGVDVALADGGPARFGAPRRLAG